MRARSWRRPVGTQVTGLAKIRYSTACSYLSMQRHQMTKLSPWKYRLASLRGKPASQPKPDGSGFRITTLARDPDGTIPVTYL
jgi:hypothetical protein